MKKYTYKKYIQTMMLAVAVIPFSLLAITWIKNRMIC